MFCEKTTARSFTGKGALALPCLRFFVVGLSLRSPGFRSQPSPLLHFWWAHWHWDRTFFEYVDFPLSLLFHQCSIHICPSTTDAIQSYQLRESSNQTLLSLLPLSLSLPVFSVFDRLEKSCFSDLMGPAWSSCFSIISEKKNILACTTLSKRKDYPLG